VVSVCRRWCALIDSPVAQTTMFSTLRLVSHVDLLCVTLCAGLCQRGRHAARRSPVPPPRTPGIAHGVARNRHPCRRGLGKCCARCCVLLCALRWPAAAARSSGSDAVVPFRCHRLRAIAGTDAAVWPARARASVVRGARAAAPASLHWDARSRHGATTITAARPRRLSPRCRLRPARRRRRSRPILATADGPSSLHARATSLGLKATARTTGARASASAAPSSRRLHLRLCPPPRSTAGAGAAGRGLATASAARGKRAAARVWPPPVVRCGCPRGATATIAACPRCLFRHRRRRRRRLARPSRAAVTGWLTGPARGRRCPQRSGTRPMMARPATTFAATGRRRCRRRLYPHRLRRLIPPRTAGTRAVQQGCVRRIAGRAARAV
jgi:hypothetical protein